jgi:hypothetical protein
MKRREVKVNSFICGRGIVMKSMLIVDGWMDGWTDGQMDGWTGR